MTDPIHSYYTTDYDEAARLVATPQGRLEALRTRALLEPRLPPAPADVLDVGGATGAHAAWLVEAGYQVRIIDLIPSHVEAALTAGFQAEVGDARRLQVASGSADVVLMLGPLYHLTASADRTAALAEAARIVRPSGLVAVAAINRWTGLLDLAINGPWAEDSLDRLAAVLGSGVHDPSLGFTTGYLHEPAQLLAEVAASGLADIEVLAVEGPLGHTVDLATEPEVAIARAAQVAALTETEPALLGASPHLLAVGRRIGHPGDDRAGDP